MRDPTNVPKYSICITNYNTRDTILESLQSILNQIDSSFEIIVCDNCSTDGSREILEKYAKKNMLKLIVERSTRGRGRQIAFANSKGNWILTGLDLDDVFKPTLKDILKIYHKEHEGYMLGFGTHGAYGIALIPRAVVQEVGGWRDLRWGEDLDFRLRVERISKFQRCGDLSDASIWLQITCDQRRRRPLYWIRETYVMYECRYHIGVSVFDFRRILWYKKPLNFLIAFAAVIVCRMKGVKRLN